MVNKDGDAVATSVTNFDIHDIARAARTYGADRYFIVTPIRMQRDFVRRIVDYWREGSGASYNPTRGDALRDVRIVRDALLGTNDWSDPSLFVPYADERRERMRRLRFVARFVTELFARFGEDATQRRKRAFERLRTQPQDATVLAAAYLGPDRMEGGLFSQEFFDRAFEA